MRLSRGGILLPVAGLLGLAGAVKTVTKTLGICPVRNTELLAPSSAPVEVQYTTTDSYGNVITTSSVSYSYYTTPPSPTSSHTVVVYSTTDGSGSSILASSTSYYAKASTSGNPLTTATMIPISMGGSTMNLPIPTGTTLTASPPEATSVNYPCPASIAQVYESRNLTAWQIFCETDFFYQDLPSVDAATFEGCIAACDAYVPTPPGHSGDMPCVGVTWTATNAQGHNCYLKSGISRVVYGTKAYLSAKRATYNPPVGGVEVSVVSTGTTVPPTIKPSTTVSTATSFASYQPASPCPLQNSSIYTYPDGLNVQYKIYCAIEFLGGDLPAVTVATFADCIGACDAFVPTLSGLDSQPCIGVTYVGYNSHGANCYLKKSYSSLVRYSNSGDSALRIGQGQQSAVSNPTSSISSAMSMGMSSAMNSALPAKTSTTSAGNFFTAESSSPMAANTPTSTLSTISAPTTAPTNAAYPCPANNNTIFVDSGYSYVVECGVSYNFQNVQSTTTTTFMACLEACSAFVPAAGKPSCVAVSWVGSTTCYLHGKGFTVTYNSRIDSAALQGYSPINAGSNSAIPATSSSTPMALPSSSSMSSRSSTYLYGSSSAPSLPSVLVPGTTATSASASPVSVVTPSNAPSPCPAAGRGSVYYDTPTKPYIVECSTSYGGRNAPNVNATTFIACMDACSAYVPAPPGDSFDQPCVAVTWLISNDHGGQCYLLSSVTSIFSEAIHDSARLQSYVPVLASSVAASSPPVSSSVASSVAPPSTAASSSSAVSSSPPIVSSVAPVPSVASSSMAALSSSVSASSLTGAGPVVASSPVASASASATPTTVAQVTASNGNSYKFLGCYTDNVVYRTLVGPANLSVISVEDCGNQCASFKGNTRYPPGPYTYFGLEYYSQCFCGQAINTTSTISTRCTFACRSTPSELCGGSNALDIYIKQ